ncbi:extracellular catalytic domain type 1 short-chain-length polyhydroxyalkanoate depolymerase [Aneurinibacillus tyrosinisolvens]|uniref:extracellular catalytic domain type 1 short-chain-length polyhydroxyalkanoate depolymerase n=1 Tax=Aneurinibacillus tyrosinisolvens TaxID=1443435 RepID=UPI00128CC00D|nr:PHB depolymerase family esterase [Aneurinibacillus tyrosinisolvens]
MLFETIANFSMLMAAYTLPFSLLSGTPILSSSPLKTGVTRHYYKNNFSFRLYVPSRYNGESSVPLLVMLHGCTQDADDFAKGTRMDELAEEKNFIVLYPEMNLLANHKRCWNWFYDYNQHRGIGEPEIIKGMVDLVKMQYAIDERKVYVAGLSAGGSMSVIMGAVYPDVFRGIGVVAGMGYCAADNAPDGLDAMENGNAAVPERAERVYNEMGMYRQTVPIIVIHGLQDKIVNPVNADQLAEQWVHVNKMVVGRNEKDRSKEKSSKGKMNGREYTRTMYFVENNEPIVEKWLIKGLGHRWSGGSNRGSYADPKGPDASELIWDFFEKRKSFH